MSEKLVDLKTRVTEEQKTYINEMAWRNRTSVTAYMQMLISEDMQKNPNWRESLDALNTVTGGKK